METSVRKFSVVSFLLLSVIAGFIFYRALGQVLDWLKLTTTVTQAVGSTSWPLVGGAIGGVAGLVTFLILSINKKSTEFTDEVFNELKKVTWPTGKETYATTIVVAGMVFIAGLMFFLLDNIWSWFFRFLLS